MSEGTWAFIICCIIGVLFIGLGIFSACSKKPAGFWANASVGEIEDVKGYNRAVGKLFAAYGIVFILCCLPIMSAEQNSPLVIVTILGIMAETIAAMIVYTIVIEKKYRKR
ncbi:MAG: hypothetical protein IJX63_03635 [Lachnospiraceae bacterium]|nr:hypothetical protein [Lachnospiraceae bacterium]